MAALESVCVCVYKRAGRGGSRASDVSFFRAFRRRFVFISGRVLGLGQDVLLAVLGGGNR